MINWYMRARKWLIRIINTIGIFLPVLAFLPVGFWAIQRIQKLEEISHTKKYYYAAIKTAWRSALEMTGVAILHYVLYRVPMKDPTVWVLAVAGAVIAIIVAIVVTIAQLESYRRAILYEERQRELDKQCWGGNNPL